MQAARDRQKSYADLKRKPMEFQVGDKVLEKVGEVAYKLELPEELKKVGRACLQNHELPEELSIAHGDGVTGIKRRRRDLSSDGVRNLAMTSGRGQLKEDLESSTW
ncbi:hypothetical protein Tco_1213092 [Tanacetum coccineum]